MDRSGARVRRRLAALAIVVFGAVLAAAGFTPAEATAPGQNGRIVFASDITGTWQLLSMKPNGLNVRLLTNLPDAGRQDLFSAVSPDGTRIVFNFNDGQGAGDELFVMNANGSDMTQLTDDPGYYHAVPSWSPDGTRVLFARCTDFSCGISAIGADGSDLVEITPQGSDFGPEYTPDGSRIVFESQRGGRISALWVMNADGSGAHRLTPGRLRAGGADVSPDGTRVVFFSNQNYPKPQSLWELNLDGTGLHRLTRPPQGHSDLWPMYSPDGRFITFASDRLYGDFCCLDVWRMNADGTGAIPLTSNLTPDSCQDANCVYPVWGPKP